MPWWAISALVLILPAGWWFGIAMSRRDHHRHPYLYPNVDWLGRHRPWPPRSR